ncbi:MAG: ribose 5-phosphate isomerase B [Parasporobacterium sp.]|nr:ribose 5-phosphate isomerase B [Parasporobacterium sp.]
MIAIGNDHAAYDLKVALKKHLEEKGYEVMDFGCDSDKSVDYPIYAKKVCEAVLAGQADKGVLLCGTGIGMSMVANKFRGIRAAVVGDAFSAEATRSHNDANVLCMGARVVTAEKAELFADIFLETEFSNEEKHARRISMIED